MSLIVLHFLHSTSVLSFYTDVILTLSIDITVGAIMYNYLLSHLNVYRSVLVIVGAKYPTDNIT